MYLILRTRLASYGRTFIVELLHCSSAAAVPLLMISALPD
jgi:hypothetical protein